jgi:type II secretory pathway predicted ATPase ExeA
VITERFGLQRLPFGKDVPVAALFPSAAQTRAAAALGFAIAERQIALLLGDVGAGKSTVLRTTLAGCSPARFPVAYLPAAPRDARDLYQSALGAFGESAPWSTAEARTRLRHVLQELADAGRTGVLIVDEAQDLTPALLTHLRTLTNFELDARPVFALVLCGHPDLARLLRRRGQEAMAQRVGTTCHLLGLTREETDRYIAHHLQLCGCVRPLFDPAATAAIFSASKGLPRLVGRAALACLEAAALAGADRVDAACAEQALADIT